MLSLVYAIFVQNHPAATEQTKEAARLLCTELEALLTSKQILAAQGRVEAITFEEIVLEALSQISPP